MNWIKFTKELPPIGQLIIIAFGHIFEESIETKRPPYYHDEGYKFHYFTSTDKNNIKSYGRTMWLSGRSVTYWSLVDNPFEKEFGK